MWFLRSSSIRHWGCRSLVEVWSKFGHLGCRSLVEISTNLRPHIVQHRLLYLNTYMILFKNYTIVQQPFKQIVWVVWLIVYLLKQHRIFNRLFIQNNELCCWRVIHTHIYVEQNGLCLLDKKVFSYKIIYLKYWLIVRILAKWISWLIVRKLTLLMYWVYIHINLHLYLSLSLSIYI